MSQLVVNGSLKEFFKLLVEEVVRRQQVSLEEVTEFYLVNMLAEYAQAEKLFTEAAEGRRDTEALAVLYHRALLQDRDEKIRTLRRLGDLSLYTSGFFHQSLEDRVVGADYYMQMGKTAYGAVAELSGATAFASVYQELHAKFSAVVEVLEEIAARGLCASGPQGQMRVFEAFSRTGSAGLRHVLVDSGVLPGTKLLN